MTYAPFHQFQKWFNQIGGQTEEEKMAFLLMAYARNQLAEHHVEISRFEARFGMTLGEFKPWLERQADDMKFRHDMERTLMEWEGHEDSREHWLGVLKEMTATIPYEPAHVSGFVGTRTL